MALLLVWSGCTPRTGPALLVYQHMPLDSTLRADSVMEAMLAPFRAQLDRDMSEVMARVARPLALYQPESPLGNLLADLMLEEARDRFPAPVDAALLNHFGIRQPLLPEGDMTIRQAYELLPFDNYLVLVALDGAMVDTLSRWIAHKGGWPVSESWRYQPGEGDEVRIRIGGQVVEPGRTYYIAMPDYIANGGDGCAFLRPLPRTESTALLRDILIARGKDRMAKGILLDGQTDGRYNLGRTK